MRTFYAYLREALDKNTITFTLTTGVRYGNLYESGARLWWGGYVNDESDQDLGRQLYGSITFDPTKEKLHDLRKLLGEVQQNINILPILADWIEEHKRPNKFDVGTRQQFQKMIETNANIAVIDELDDDAQLYNL